MNSAFNVARIGPLVWGEGMGADFTITWPSTFAPAAKVYKFALYDKPGGTRLWSIEQTADDTVWTVSGQVTTMDIDESTVSDALADATTPAYSTLTAGRTYAFAIDVSGAGDPLYRMQGLWMIAQDSGDLSGLTAENFDVTFPSGFTVTFSSSATGSGDVTAASNFGTDNLLIKSDGVLKGVQATGISIDDSDNITGVGTVDGRDLATDGTKLDGIEALADKTDATNVNAAGATMNTDSDVSGNTWVIDEDAMGSDLATKVPTQQSTKAYVDNNTRWVGKDTIFVPAAAMRPTSSNGCASITDVETTAGRPDLQVLDFDASSDEHAQFQVCFPKSWNLGTVTYQVFWTSTATDTDGVTWALQGVAVSNDGTIDVAYGTAITVDDAVISAAEDLLVTAESAAVTIAGTPADDDTCFFRVFRDVSDANDTATEDARLIGIKIFFTTDAKNDA